MFSGALIRRLIQCGPCRADTAQRSGSSTTAATLPWRASNAVKSSNALNGAARVTLAMDSSRGPC
jgi:hypothetical protein